METEGSTVFKKASLQSKDNDLKQWKTQKDEENEGWRESNKYREISHFL
jgi:hypothetical protein